MRIVSRALYPEHLSELVRQGVYEAVQPEFEAGLEMVRQVLVHFGHSTQDIVRLSDAVRDDLYGPMWEGGLADRYQRILEELGHAESAVGIGWTTVSARHLPDETTLAELDLKQRTGAIIVAIVHGRTVDVNPGPESPLHPGDRAALLGTTAQRRAARALLEGAETERDAAAARHHH
jgi:CPA2 family monovalent cation:H+ antiporter-2